MCVHVCVCLLLLLISVSYFKSTQSFGGFYTDEFFPSKIAEAQFRRFTFEKLCKCWHRALKMILSDDNLSLSGRYRDAYLRKIPCNMEAIILSRLGKFCQIIQETCSEILENDGKEED